MSRTARVTQFRARHADTVRGGAATVSFFVPGNPKPQGNHRTNAQGVIYETTKGHGPWVRSVADYARVQVRASGRVFHAPCKLVCAFSIPIPKRSPFTMPVRRSRDGDTSKLVRAVEDALVAGGLLVDDSLVVELVASKRFGAPAGVHITVEEVAHAEPDPA